MFHAWSTAVIYYCTPHTLGHSIRLTAATLYIAAVFSFVILGRNKKLRLILSLAGFIVVAAFFISIRPDPHAAYPEYLRAAYVEFNGPKVTIHDVRNNNYRTRDDFDVFYEPRTYDIGQLQTLDVFVNYWCSSLVAHTFLSFGFSDGKFLSVSVENRIKSGETYDMWAGLFKQYELVYIWADERDLVRLRTNYRKEDVYLYRVKMKQDDIRKLFVSMLKRTNKIYNSPEFYNTILHSCTNTISSHLDKEAIIRRHFWRRHILTGDIDRRSYKEGLLYGGNLPFDKLREISKINLRAEGAGKDGDFSNKIRTHIDLFAGQ